jgi:NB-ARC domain
VPQHLPAAVGPFVGRTRELALLDGWLGQLSGGSGPAVSICAIGGMPGVGKTALAVHWAHRVAGRFPDGQLYVDLRGFDPGAQPADPAAVLQAFLLALGVPPGDTPAHLDARAALYRSVLAGRRMLVVADNARDSAHVRPLLAGTPGSAVLVTSRSSLGGLAAAKGARLLSLNVLTDNDAAELLAARLGHDHVAADPQVSHLCPVLEPHKVLDNQEHSGTGPSLTPARQPANTISAHSKTNAPMGR